MSEPKVDPLSEDLVSLLDAERERSGASEELAGKLWTRLELSASFALADARVTPTSKPISDPQDGATNLPDPAMASASAGVAGAGARLIVRYGAVAAISFALGVGADRLVDSIPTRRKSPASAPAPSASASAVVPAPPSSIGTYSFDELENVAPSPSRPVNPAPAASASADPGAGAESPAERDAALARELSLLAVARTAVARREGARALEALEQHAREFPAGRLGEERDGLRVQALALVGRRKEARDQAERFKAEHPDSIFGRAIDAVTEPGADGGRRAPR